MEEYKDTIAESTESSASLTTLAKNNGLIIAIISVVISLVLHFVNPLMIYTTFWLPVVLFFVFIGLLVYAGTAIRKQLGGYWTFGDAFKAFLIMALIISAITTLYNVVLMKVIDPELPKKAAVAVEQAQRQMMDKMGLTTEQVDEALAKNGNMEEKLTPSIKNVVSSFGISLALYAILSLILAAILKKNPPLFEPETRA